MTVPTHFHMPGAFQAEGVHPGLFRPPISPSSSTTSYGYAPRTSTPSYDTSSKRKRNRHDISRSRDLRMDDDMEPEGIFSTPVARPDLQRYQLAGQLDTPNGGPVDGNALGESMYSDSDYRKALGSKRARDDFDANLAEPTPLFNLPPQPTPTRGWSTAAFGAIGGVVGRVWEFCKAGAFRGFSAGGGRAFEMTDGGIQEVFPGDGHHVPGRFPESQDFAESQQYVDAPEEQLDSGASTPTAPAAKRRHTDQRDDLGRNWVMVGDQSRPVELRTPQRRASRPVPRARNQGPSMSAGRRISTPAPRMSTATPVSNRRPASRASVNRPSSRLSYAPSPIITTQASTASFASSRSPSPSKIPRPSHSRNSSFAAASSPSHALGHRRSQSNASTASNRGDVMDNSPRLNAEAKHLASRRKVEEREADARISAFNKQLQDMIRQGKEALGTTIEVEGNWEDEET